MFLFHLIYQMWVTITYRNTTLHNLYKVDKIR